MPGLREAGLLGAAVAIAGGATFVAWSYVTSREKPEREREEAAAVTSGAAQPVAASEEVEVRLLNGFIWWAMEGRAGERLPPAYREDKPIPQIISYCHTGDHEYLGVLSPSSFI